MAGLDRIIARIQDESEKAAAQILEEAKARAGQLLKEAEDEAGQECALIEKKARQTADNILERGRSAAELKKRQRILAEKQALISEILNKAKREMKAMPDGAYFDGIVKLAVKAAQKGEGRILFSQADLARLPEHFGDTLNAALKAGGKEGAALAVSGETRDIDSGFVLTYGGIEENCSFDALFDSDHEALQDKVQELLFGTV